MVPLDELLQQSDAVSLHVPAHEGWCRAVLGAARAGPDEARHAVIVNTARGGSIDEDALLDAVNSGTAACAELPSTCS
jgi:phosphoglycerate dehydrogenase-like enzyme